MHGNTSESRSRRINCLTVGGVIGDVLDRFVPTVDMTVHYGSKEVTNGCELTPSLLATLPAVQIRDHDDERSSYFTLVMTDPDFPSPGQPSLREYVHWIVTDIPGATHPLEGWERISYEAPVPTLGIHRYVFTLFKQRLPNQILNFPHLRHSFSTRRFAQCVEIDVARSSFVWAPKLRW